MRSCEKKSLAKFTGAFFAPRSLAASVVGFFEVIRPVLPAFVVAAVLLAVGPMLYGHSGHASWIDKLPLMSMGVRFPQTHDGPVNRGNTQFGAINSTRVIQVDKSAGAMLEYSCVIMRGSLVVSAGTASGTSLGPNPGNLIQQIKYVAPSAGRYPGGDIKKLSPRTLLASNIFNAGQLVNDSALTGAAGTFTVEQPFWIRHSQPDSPRPFDFALKMDEYGGHSIQILTGGRDTQFSGNDRTFDFSGMNFSVVDKREIQVEGTLAKNVMFESDDVLQVAAANTRLGYNGFPVDGRIYDMNIWTETTNQALADTILNQVIIKYGGQQFLLLTGSDMKALQRDQYKDAAQVMTGLYNVPFNANGLIGGAVPNANIGDVSAELNVANPGGANVDRLIFHTKRVFSPGLDFVAPTT